MTRIASSPFQIQVQGAAASLTGLDFPSNGGSPANAFVAFQFANPHLNGLPIWGPGGAGATYIWKIFPRQQTGYYVTFWWSNADGSFWWDNGQPNTYYGCHPYPKSGDASGTDHNWEIATDYGGDEVITRAGSPKTVVKGRWYTQALRVTRNGNGTKTLVFYIDLPSVANADVIEWTLPAGYGETNPPQPKLTIGDSPWYAGLQHERLSGIVRGFKFFNRVLSQADTLSEAASDNLVTSAGQANIWWKKINPTPTDLLCEAGTGRNPAWAQTTKAALWTG
jgi:hypothetical protein